eukprot:m.61787 g.61787  ORF g.61787 m.61787 type:complete len:442 (+) comp11447_c0_seq1:116-1441(+)
MAHKNTTATTTTTTLFVLYLTSCVCQHVQTSANFNLTAAIIEGITPVLQNLSATHNNSAWAFSYRDDDINVSMCVGYADIINKVPCKPSDKFAWGSTTKPTTSIMILMLQEAGKLKLDDPFVPYANPFLKLINNSLDLIDLYGPTVSKVTIRHLLQHYSGMQEYDDEMVRVYQNNHRDEDLGPDWIIATTNRTFICEPGTCGRYSSTNYVHLGLVLGHFFGLKRYDELDQTRWFRNNTYAEQFLDDLMFADHGLLSNFSASHKPRRGSTISGYQPVCDLSRHFEHRCVNTSMESDVISMSSLQGWTCGNLIAPVSVVADFFWLLLGKKAILREESLQEMLTFKQGDYFGYRPPSWGYGLGMMNFTNMTWGFSDEGLYYGHNGLTYGFGSQQGYNYPLKFSASWVNNFEKWIGPDARRVPNQLYTTLCSIVREKRLARESSA